MLTAQLQIAAGIKELLEQRRSRLVLAESCTAGRVAATLGCLPGISHSLCGGFVVYRCDSKTRWLGVPAEMLNDPQLGPVSEPTTQWLARAAVEATPEARFGLAVTGDIGPGASPQTDGLVCVAWYDRSSQLLQSARQQLQHPAPTSAHDVAARLSRLEEATLGVLHFGLEQLKNCEE